jgi:hypothetical protein
VKIKDNYQVLNSKENFMEIRDISNLLTIDEHAFHKLLDGNGKVHVRIDNFGKYYVPFVFFTDPEVGEIVPQGVVVRNDCMFAAKTKEEVFSVIKEFADESDLDKINTIE